MGEARAGEMGEGVGTTALGALVKAVGEARRMAVYGMVGAAAFVGCAVFVDLVQVAHVDSVQRLHEAAARIAMMHADGTRPGKVAYAFRDEARLSLLKAFGGGTTSPAPSPQASVAAQHAMAVDFEGTVGATTDCLRGMVSRAGGGPLSVAERGGVLADAMEASTRVRSAMRRTVGQADGMTPELGAEVARLYALDAALEAVQRRASAGDLAGVGEDPNVVAALRGPDRMVLAFR